MFPAGLTLLDGAALAVLVATWLGYGWVIHAFRLRASITTRMGDVR